jgi:hypothetical protein
MVMIIDRTSSMDPTDLIKAKTAAKSVLEILNPNRQRVALGVLPAMGAGECAGTDAGWVPVRLSNDYQNPDGTLNTNSLLVRTIDNCLNSPESVTNLSAPMLAAKEHLLEDRTVDVKKGIILLTDGKPNDPGYGGPGGPFPCRLAFEASDLAQQAGIEIFTIGFGVAGQRCNESGSRYHNTLVTQLLADMASPVSNDNGCTDAENADGDHFLCQPKTENLTPIFKQAAAALASGSKLVHVPMGQ